MVFLKIHISDIQIEKAARILVDNPDYREVLIRKLDESGLFEGGPGPQGPVGEIGSQGPVGPVGEVGPKGPATWPNGTYAIFKNGDCPKGFYAVHGYLGAISMYARDPSYLKEAKIGSSQIRWHSKNEAYGLIDLLVCVKDY